MPRTRQNQHYTKYHSTCYVAFHPGDRETEGVQRHPAGQIKLLSNNYDVARAADSEKMPLEMSMKENNGENSDDILVTSLSPSQTNLR
jgi:hypothetical protein